MNFTIRFDFRNPSMAGTSAADRYGAALDMVEWADELGCVNISVAEHHGSQDEYIPSPLVMLAAMAQRAPRAQLSVGALIAPLHDPLRLAEDIVVLDNICKGRLTLLLVNGYVAEEFVMFDVSMRDRGDRMTETVKTLRGAFSGQPFEFRGRTVQVTPGPYQQGGPLLMMGGGSKPAARRAALLGDGFVTTIPDAWQWYRDEVLQLGKPDPGPFVEFGTVNVMLAQDPALGWEQMAPYFMHEMNSYGAWQVQDKELFWTVADMEELRMSGRYRVVTPAQLIEELRSTPSPMVNLHPLCGGMPLDLAWESLRLFETEVLPALAAKGSS